MPSGERHDLVPVPSHLEARSRGLVAGGEAHALHLRQGLRQQRALQGHRGVVLAPEEDGVVDRHRRPPRQVLGELEVGFVELAVGIGADQGEGAEDPVAGDKGQDHRRGEAQLPHQPQVLLVLGRLHQHLLGDLGIDLGLPGADHVRRAGLGVRVRRIAGPQVMGQLDLIGVDVGDHHVARCFRPRRPARSRTSRRSSARRGRRPAAGPRPDRETRPATRSPRRGRRAARGCDAGPRRGGPAPVSGRPGARPPPGTPAPGDRTPAPRKSSAKAPRSAGPRPPTER